MMLAYTNQKSTSVRPMLGVMRNALSMRCFGRFAVGFALLACSCDSSLGPPVRHCGARIGRRYSRSSSWPTSLAFLCLGGLARVTGTLVVSAALLEAIDWVLRQPATRGAAESSSMRPRAEPSERVRCASARALGNPFVLASMTREALALDRSDTWRSQ